MTICREKMLADLPSELIIDHSPLERGENSLLSMKQSWESILPHIGSNSKQHFVGHRMAALEYYPKDFNDNSRWQCYRPLSELLHEGYEVVGCDSIELDLQLLDIEDGSETEPVLCVTHDKPNWEEAFGMLDFIQENSFQKVLSEYVEKEYWRSHKLDLELKLHDNEDINIIDEIASLFSFKCDENDERLISSILTTIEEVIGNHQEAIAIRSSLRFVSFSLDALEYTYKQAGDAYSYIYIATTNHTIYKLITLFSDHSPLGRKMIIKLKNDTPWLTGMWFDPKFIKDSVDTISGIQNARTEPLELMIAAYYSEFDEIVSELAKGSSKLDISGVIFDFCTTSS